jgi:hypothetical protein
MIDFDPRAVEATELGLIIDDVFESAGDRELSMTDPTNQNNVLC